MDFHGTNTIKNLARAFAGECQAGMRYQLIARACMQQGYETLAGVLRTIAKNETNHARTFFEAIGEQGKGVDNIRFEAGYPFHSGSVGDSLRFAAKDEREESTVIYPAFAKAAREEGFEQIALKFDKVAIVEDHHRIIFEYLCEAFEDGSLFNAERPMLWICGECGYMHTAKSAPKVCPLCGESRGKFELHLPFKKENL